MIADSANIVDGEFTREYLQRLTRHVARIELKKEGGAAAAGRGRAGVQSELPVRSRVVVDRAEMR